MRLTADENVSVATENSGTTTPTKETQPAIPAQRDDRLTLLIEQREAFIQDRFSTTLEDLATGKRIRS